MKMKLTLAGFALIAVTMMAAPAFAQSATPQHVAKIPFAFQVGGTEMPAGEYVITMFGNRVQVREVRANKAATVAAVRFEGRITSAVSHLHFDTQGEEPVLATVYFAGQQDGIELINKKVRAASRM